jgi:hypothetical protein
MVHKFARARALTDETKRITFAASGLSFRAYNELYEMWLENRYRDDIKPYTSRSAHHYDPYLTETGYENTLQHTEGAIAFARKLQEQFEDGDRVEHIAQLWREMGKVKREELVLEVFEGQCRRSEMGEYIWTREDTPELTLEWATSFDKDGIANWIRLWFDQGQTEEERRKSEKDEDALGYRNLRNDKWDRVNGVFEIENAFVPVKKSIRAFVHDGIARRNQFLRQFIRELSGCVVSLLPPPSIKSSRYLTLASTSSRKRQSSRPRNLKPESRNRMQPRCSLAYKRKESVSGSASTLGSRR